MSYYQLSDEAISIMRSDLGKQIQYLQEQIFLRKNIMDLLDSEYSVSELPETPIKTDYKNATTVPLTKEDLLIPIFEYDKKLEKFYRELLATQQMNTNQMEDPEEWKYKSLGLNKDTRIGKEDYDKVEGDLT